jgi:rhombotail lipoprotein
MLAGQRHHASSLVEYLYSGEVGKVEEPVMPTLRLPLRVGVAFVPPNLGTKPETISERDKLELLREIRSSFDGLEFVESIQAIPTPYLRPRGGFTNLDQLRTLLGVDVMVLLSYDQIQFVGEGFESFSYWTIIGAYVVRGERNSTHTLIDAAVYDIASRNLLFRAPGTSEVTGTATPVNLDESLRLARTEGFKQAAADLVPRLKSELETFKKDVEEERAAAKVVTRPGYTGSGSTGLLTLMLAAVFGGTHWFARFRKA